MVLERHPNWYLADTQINTLSTVGQLSDECWPAHVHRSKISQLPTKMLISSLLTHCQPSLWYTWYNKIMIVKQNLWFNGHSRRFKSTTMTNLLQVAGSVNFWMWHVKAMLWKEFTDSLVMNVLKAMLWIYISDDSCDDFENKFGHNSGFSLNDVLWTCSNMFSKR